MNIRLLVGLFLAALSVIGFASTFVFGAALTKGCGVSAESLSFLRFAIAGGVMLAVELARPRSRRRLFAMTRADVLRIAWLGPVGTSVMAWCVFMGCARVSAANASMADALTPLMIFVVAALRCRRIEPRELFGLVCGFVGSLLVIQVLHAGGLALSAYSVGDLYIFFAAATWGFYTVYGREMISRLGAAPFTVWTMLAGAFSLGVVLAVQQTAGLGCVAWPSTAKAWALTAGLGLVSTLLPFWTWNAAQRYLPVSVLGVTAYFTPVIAVALAILFLDEHATGLQWLGTLLIVLSAAVETRRAS